MSPCDALVEQDFDGAAVAKEEALLGAHREDAVAEKGGAAPDA